MKKNEKLMLAILAILLTIFALASLYFNVLMPRGKETTVPLAKPVMREKPIQLNNNLKTSVTVLPAPDAQQ